MKHVYCLLFTVLFAVSQHAQLSTPTVHYQAKLVASQSEMASGDSLQIRWEITSDTGSIIVRIESEKRWFRKNSL